MSVDTMIRTITADTGETIPVPELPADDRTGTGYDWMETLEGTGWVALPNWGSEGWDAGTWPLIILTVARTRDGGGELFGYGTYIEGDTASYWFRSQSACFEAITAEVFFHWNMEHGTWNMEHGTWNMEHGTSRRTDEPAGNGRRTARQGP